MTKDTTKAAAVAADIMLFDNWFELDRGRRSRTGARLHRNDAGRGTGRRPVPATLRATQGERE